MIGERLRGLREDADLTQDQLAKILQINKFSISSYERNKSEPPDSVKIAIAKHFNVSIDYLLGMTKSPRPYAGKDGYIKLPAGFPEKYKNKLLEYIDYLLYTLKNKR